MGQVTARTGPSSHSFTYRVAQVRPFTRVLQNADIGAASSALFRQVSVTACAGSVSTPVGGLFSGQNRVWSFGPEITQPISQAGRLSAELDLAKLRKSSAVAESAKSIQLTFREVADGLARSATYLRTIAAQTEVVNQDGRSAMLAAQLRYAGFSGRHWTPSARSTRHSRS
ncbi:TolC family protein [Achromobacter insolitus]|uniref:TolC family protein n=1 Tax=Achromobacter insolitus TaxID=217204 RepID=UPI0039900A92